MSEYDKAAYKAFYEAAMKRAKKAESERDELKAEVAGLKDEIIHLQDRLLEEGRDL